MAAPKSLTVTVDKVASVLKAMRGLERNQVMVGIPASTAERQPDPTDPHPDLNNAEIGYLLDRGDPAKNLPARPWLKPGIETAKDVIVETYKDGAKAILDGRVSNADKVHTKVGIIAAKAVQQKIIDGPFAPLAPRTLAERKASGFKGTAPLIVTGQLKNAVTSVIRPKGS